MNINCPNCQHTVLIVQAAIGHRVSSNDLTCKKCGTHFAFDEVETGESAPISQPMGKASQPAGSWWSRLLKK
ncbi:MAG: hypothetical protein FJ387_03665 [Verrucomicrobia bacterium]|nr:hypothetical protein [Verrucomicrobiota bacterium]